MFDDARVEKLENLYNKYDSATTKSEKRRVLNEILEINPVVEDYCYAYRLNDKLTHDELKDKIKEAETELSKAMAEVDMKLKTQKSEMDVKHTEEKAQMLVAYNQQLNHYKLKYNELAKDYNHLLGDASSLSRINILLSGRHKSIVKDKEPVELEEIEVEEPTETIEYVPKDNITLI